MLAAGNVAQFPGRNASGGYGSGELEALLDQLQYVSNGPGLPLLEVLANMNLGDEGWLPVLHRLVSSTGNEAYGQASAPNVVDAQSQSDDYSGQCVKGLSGVCMPHPGAVQCGAGNPTGKVGPGCLENPSYASRPVVTVDGQCADSGGVLPESFRVSGGNMPHPMGSVRAGDTLGEKGFEVTAPIQSSPPTLASTRVTETRCLCQFCFPQQVYPRTPPTNPCRIFTTPQGNCIHACDCRSLGGGEVHRRRLCQTCLPDGVQRG